MKQKKLGSFIKEFMRVYKKYSDRRIYCFTTKKLVSFSHLKKTKKILVIDENGKKITGKVKEAIRTYGKQGRHKMGCRKDFDKEKKIKKLLKEGRSYKEIAKCMNCAYSTIQSYVYRNDLNYTKRKILWKKS